MSTRVKLPPGCAGFRKTADNSTIDSDSDSGSGRTVTLEGPDEKALMKSQHRAIGLVTPETWTIGTKRGRWCGWCARIWQAWSVVCPRCGEETAELEPADPADPAEPDGVDAADAVAGAHDPGAPESDALPASIQSIPSTQIQSA